MSNPGDDAPPAKLTLGAKVFWALVILGLGAAGVGAINVYLDNNRQSEALEERGIYADVRSAAEVGDEGSTRLRVSYDPRGPEILEFAHVTYCSGARYEPGQQTRVVYLPDDPEVVRLEPCLSSFNTDVLPGIVGITFIALALLIPWRLRQRLRGA